MMNDNINTLFPEGGVHCMQNLKSYNLYDFPSSVKQAFFVSPKRVEIELFDGVTLSNNKIVLYSYDYDSFNDETGVFKTHKECESIFTIKGNVLVVENNNFDLNKNYLIEINGVTTKVFLSPFLGGILDTYFDASDIKDLGLSYSGAEAKIKVWSPPAAKINLIMFDKMQNILKPLRPLEFSYTEKGVWEIDLRVEDFDEISTLDGLFYQLEVFAYGKKRLALDPYAKSMAAFNPAGTDKIGKAAIVDLNSKSAMPGNFKKHYSNLKYMSNETDMIAYEVHTRDFTIQPGLVAEEIAGTFKGFIEKIDHLKKLGITHVQLMPVNSFYTVDETKKNYSSRFEKVSNYNWGYDPHNYFSLDGWFSTDASNPYSRILEFRTLVQALHDNGIGVIMDVVYNHTYTVEVFENVAPGCYYRYDESLRISGKTGAGPSLESRRIMMRKLILDALSHFVSEYHIDGFRFDLMGFHDHQTMAMIRNEAGLKYNSEKINDLILQGEGWVFSDIDTGIFASEHNAATTKINHPQSIGLSFFNDTFRDAVGGYKFNKGFAQGNGSVFDKVATAVVAGTKSFDPASSIVNTVAFSDIYHVFSENPLACLNYLSIHDGFTLWDKINLNLKDAGKHERTAIMRLAAAILFTSQGRIVLHGGDEILRTKPLAAYDREADRAFTSVDADVEEGTLYFHENSYCSNDYTNMIRWDRLENEYSPFALSVLNYYKGLIQMRRSIPCFRYNNAENIKRGLTFIGPPKKTTGRALYNGFLDDNLDFLELHFFNGPANERYYIAGEVYPHEMPGNADNMSMYFVDFDGFGKGKIRFDRKQIMEFDINKWGEHDCLSIKLVKTPGEWDAVQNAYSPTGNNALYLNAINAFNQVYIDLSLIDYAAVEAFFVPPQFLAYHLDNTLENGHVDGCSTIPYSEFVVVHNAGSDALTLKVSYISKPDEWEVILDGHNAGITPLAYVGSETLQKGETNVFIDFNALTVPRKSAAVIGKICKEGTFYAVGSEVEV